MKKCIYKLVLKAFPFLLLEVMMSICVNVSVTRGNSIISSVVDNIISGIDVELKEYVFLFVGLTIIGFIAAFVQKYSAATFSNKVCTGYRKLIVDKLFKMEYRFFAKNNTGTFINKIIGDLGIIEELLDSTFPEVLSNFISTIIYAMFIGRMNFGLFLLMAVSYPLIFWIANTFVKKMRRLSEIHREKTDAMACVTQSAISGIMIIRTFGLETIFRKKMDYACDALVENEQSRTSISNTTLVIRQLLQWLPNIICAIYAVYLVRNGNLSIGNLVAFVLILSRFVESFVSLPFLFVDASSGFVCIDRMEEILAKDEESGGTYAGNVSGDEENIIEFNDVYFSYDDKNPVLEGINLTVNKGDSVAIIGESGGGKSTIINLLCGMYECDKGDIKIYGHSISKWNKHALRKQISLVSQDVFLFPVSIEENVAFGKDGATHEEIVTACKEANIHDFIMSLPEGYQTVVGERGTRLSGGQKQRISIARAILKDAPIMIMDEPTSSVDVETENQIQNEIEKIRKGKTSITIAHRLNTIKNCSHVYKIVGGKCMKEVNVNE